jgi:hypothetical protein
MGYRLSYLLTIWLSVSLLVAGADPSRRPADEKERKAWLENMVWFHRYTPDEITAATGLDSEEIHEALRRLDIRPETRPRRPEGSPLLVLPYPGGRHPRIGFLEGAVNPQRETKVSVFTPWDESSYVVLDVPEAIFSNLGLIYLAHTHEGVPTIWQKRGIVLEPREWQRRDDGSLTAERTLPNGIVFGTRVVPRRDRVAVEQWLTNGTAAALSGVRVQDCVLLKGAKGFASQTNDNKVIRKPYVACRSNDGRRWVIAAWEPCDRVWANPPCPCLHSDPKFPDCPPAATVRVRGGVWFYEGADIEAELRRIDRTAWRGG